VLPIVVAWIRSSASYGKLVVTITLAPGIADPAMSFTVPVKVADFIGANSDGASPTAKIAVSAKRHIQFLFMRSPS